MVAVSKLLVISWWHLQYGLQSSNTSYLSDMLRKVSQLTHNNIQLILIGKQYEICIVYWRLQKGLLRNFDSSIHYRYQTVKYRSIAVIREDCDFFQTKWCVYFIQYQEIQKKPHFHIEQGSDAKVELFWYVLTYCVCARKSALIGTESSS